MKRMIRSSSDPLEFTYPNGEVGHLPEWYSLRSPEEVAKAKEILIDEFNHPSKPKNYDEEYTPAISDKDLRALKKELRKEGFSTKEINQIEYRVTSGWSVDSAIQEALAD